jgi:predicted GIY-YIG superfamily endonuclease
MKGQLSVESENPLIILEVNGNLRLKGTDEQQVTGISQGEDDLVIEPRQDHIYVHCKDSLSLQVPRRSEIKTEIVAGNASFKGLEGELELQRVAGNLELRSVGPVRIGEAKGNLLARRVAGDLTIDTVYGNASIEDVQGSLLVRETIKCNLTIDEVGDDIQAIASGNLSARVHPLPGNGYDLRAGGNLACSLPEDASVEVHILKASKISIGFGSQNVPRQTEAPFSFSLGDGAASVSLSAGGILTVSGAPGFHQPGAFGINFNLTSDDIPEDFGTEISHQIEAQMEMLGRQIEFQMETLSSTLMSSGLSEEAVERISRKAREASERATKRAQEKMLRAQEKIERKVEAARRKAEMKSRVARRNEQRQERKVSWKGSPEADQISQEEAVSGDERLLILRMLEEKKITLEQAEQLFSALEGAGE